MVRGAVFTNLASTRVAGAGNYDEAALEVYSNGLKFAPPLSEILINVLGEDAMLLNSYFLTLLSLHLYYAIYAHFSSEGLASSGALWPKYQPAVQLHGRFKRPYAMGSHNGSY